MSRPWALNKIINIIQFCSDAPSCPCNIPCFSKTVIFFFFIAKMVKYCFIVKGREFCSRHCLKEGPDLEIKQHFYLQVLVWGFHQVTEGQSCSGLRVDCLYFISEARSPKQGWILFHNFIFMFFSCVQVSPDPILDVRIPRKLVSPVSWVVSS